MKPLYYLLLITLGCFVSCINSDEADSSKTTLAIVENDGILFSFDFVGCNRIYRTDQNNPLATNGSTANLSALKRIFSEILSQKKKSELFFFLGDLVLAESTTDNLNNQLSEWVTLYHDTSFSMMSNSGIEMIAIPGNHEMLFYDDSNQKEWPLKGATEIWMNHMSKYMPTDRDRVTDIDTVANQMTYSFVRHNVGFVIMNTDTYNAPTKDHPQGEEGMIPTQWVINKVEQYRKDSSIDHVFVLGHKPYYINCQPETGHSGLPAGPELWPKLEESHVAAMLSAHVHQYQRMQPGNEGTYQIIAGNGGSKGETNFFGYSTINILKNGEVQLISKGFEIGDPYYKAVPNNEFHIKDSTVLTWEKNMNPYKPTECD
jgi:hypothetical protein